MSDLPLAVSLLLFVGALVGHGALLTASHNYWYGKPLARRVTDVIQLFHGLGVALAPLVLWWVGGWRPETALDFSPDHPGRLLLSLYLCLCWLVGFVGLPLDTLRRLWRGTPAVQVREATTVVNVEKHLGYKPTGDGKYHKVARWPGNQVFEVAFVERELRLPRLPPALDGLTVLHLTDLHWCGTPDRFFFEHVLDRCRELTPDVVAFTGDLVDSLPHHRWIAPILGRLRWAHAGLAIMGNHDLWYRPEGVRRRLKRLGWQVISNGWLALEVRGEPVVVIGHEGPWLGGKPDLQGCPEGPFRLCLSHTPDNMGWARQQAIDLMLSGHVHGGQIRLPLFGPIVMPSTHGRWYDRGVFHEGQTVLHVSSGLAGKHPLRYGCRPEVVLLTLRSAERPNS